MVVASVTVAKPFTVSQTTSMFYATLATLVVTASKYGVVTAGVVVVVVVVCSAAQKLTAAYVVSAKFATTLTVGLAVDATTFVFS